MSSHSNIKMDKYQKLAVKQYEFENLTAEEQAKKRQQEREDRAKRYAAKQAQLSQQNAPPALEADEEEEEEDLGERIKVRILRPPEKRKTKTHTTVKMYMKVPFAQVADALKAKFKIEHIILKFDGDVIHPSQTPEEVGIEDQDQIDAEYPKGQSFDEFFDLGAP